MAETKTLTLTEFLSARIAEDEMAARAVPPLDHNFDMGGNRQDERFVFDRTLPSSADGMGNWSKHRHAPTTAAHFLRHDPARVLAECEAKRRIVERASVECICTDHGLDRIDGCPQCVACHAVILTDGYTLADLATPYADHPDYRDEWRP